MEQRAWFDKVVPMVDARGSAQRNVSNAVEALTTLGYVEPVRELDEDTEVAGKA